MLTPKPVLGPAASAFAYKGECAGNIRALGAGVSVDDTAAFTFPELIGRALLIVARPTLRVGEA